MHSNTPNPYARAAHRCPCCLLLLSWRKQRLGGYCLEHSPTRPQAPQWHDETSQACFCCRLCDRRDVNQRKWPVPAQPHVHHLRSTRDAQQQPQRGFCHTSTLRISSLSLTQIPLDHLRRLEEQSYSVIPDGTRQAFLLIAEMLATERMSPHGFGPCTHAAFKCHCCNISRHCLCIFFSARDNLIDIRNKLCICTQMGHPFHQ